MLNLHNQQEKNNNGKSTSTENAHRFISDIVAMNALELSKAIKNRDLSCVGVMEAYLKRIEEVNPIHNAIISLRDYEELLSEAG